MKKFLGLSFVFANALITVCALSGFADGGAYGVAQDQSGANMCFPMQNGVAFGYAADNSGDCTQWAQEVEGSRTLEGCGSVEIREKPRGDIQDFDIYVGGVYQMPLLKVEFLSDKEMQVTPHTLQYSNTGYTTLICGKK